MQQKCSRCQTPYDFEDAFCRKCGASLAYEVVQDAPSREIISEPVVREVKTGEIITVEGTSNLLGNSVDTGKAILKLSKKVGSKVSEALKTEQGRKLTQGATALAIAVGVELVNQAAGKLAKGSQPGSTGKEVTDNKLAVRQPSNLTEAVLKAVEDRFIQPQTVQNSPVEQPEVEETIIKERIIIKRTWRKSNS